MEEEKKVSKSILKACDRYLSRLRNGECIMRDSAGRVQWADGRPIGATTFQYMLDEGMITNLDCDLFGDANRGQTIGLTS